jgi:DNA-binding response OmpR family regulator
MFDEILRWEPGQLSWGPLSIDLVRGVVWGNRRELALQPLQIRILAFLMLNAGRVVTCEELRSDVFRAAQAPRSSGIARQICVLRSRLGPFGSLVTTEPGGYALRQGAEA